MVKGSSEPHRRYNQTIRYRRQNFAIFPIAPCIPICTVLSGVALAWPVKPAGIA